jgi:hypothetical protein
LGSTAKKLHLKNNNHPKSKAISGPEFNGKWTQVEEYPDPGYFLYLNF